MILYTDPVTFSYLSIYASTLVFGAIVNCIVFKISKSSCSLLVYREVIGFRHPFCVEVCVQLLLVQHCTDVISVHLADGALSAAVSLLVSACGTCPSLSRVKSAAPVLGLLTSPFTSVSCVTAPAVRCTHV